MARLAPGDGKDITIQYLVPEYPEDDGTANISGDVKLAIERVAQFKKMNPWPQMKKRCLVVGKSKAKIHWEYKKATPAAKGKTAQSDRRKK